MNKQYRQGYISISKCVARNEKKNVSQGQEYLVLCKKSKKFYELMGWHFHTEIINNVDGP